MVWGAFGTKGKSELVVLEGRQNSGHYIYTVSEHLLPFAHKHYGTDFVFMQDNASIHSSNETRMFFEEIGVQLLDWPARSPDLNPIENVWAILSRKVYAQGKQYNNVPELTAAVMQAWDSLTIKELQDLLDTIPARCFEVARKNGDKTHF
ncbi:Transposase [Phytophthora cinnamomi]|uniref:Transposase n=1 Tax=Phytophthora cinnamomi TaxID=4785 RepID=UPI00355A740A|nr:Transposase [Phytophthora cinnamomi]